MDDTEPLLNPHDYETILPVGRLLIHEGNPRYCPIRQVHEPHRFDYRYDCGEGAVTGYYTCEGNPAQFAPRDHAACTENGLEKVSTARRKIEALRSRLNFLHGRIREMEESGEGARTGHLHGERSALEWALPILEAEWGRLVRLRQDVGLMPNSDNKNQPE